MIFKIIIAITFAALTLIAGVFSFGFLSIQNTLAQNEARSQCAQSVRYEVKTDTTTISYPPDNLYQKCLKEKGL
jgi:hypothetical protein